VNLRAAAGVALFAVSLSTVAACGGGGGGAGDHAASGSPARAVATAGRTPADQPWWSAGAARGASRSGYCALLRQTEAARKRIFAGTPASDPQFQTTVRAFVAEVSRLAPGPVAAAWRTLGAAVMALAASGGDLTQVKGIDAAQVRRAATAVAADAKAECHLSLSR
jgi:hypothetical protein